MVVGSSTILGILQRMDRASARLSLLEQREAIASIVADRQAKTDAEKPVENPQPAV